MECKCVCVCLSRHSLCFPRGENQIDPATRRALLAALLTAQPRILEPVFAVEVQTEESCVSAIQQVRLYLCVCV